VLEAGESHEIARVGVAVVQALRDAVVVLCAPTVPHTGLAARFEGYSMPRLARNRQAACASGAVVG